MLTGVGEKGMAGGVVQDPHKKAAQFNKCTSNAVWNSYKIASSRLVSLVERVGCSM